MPEIVCEERSTGHGVLEFTSGDGRQVEVGAFLPGQLRTFISDHKMTFYVISGTVRSNTNRRELYHEGGSFHIYPRSPVFLEAIGGPVLYRYDGRIPEIPVDDLLQRFQNAVGHLSKIFMKKGEVKNLFVENLIRDSGSGGWAAKVKESKDSNQSWDISVRDSANLIVLE